MKSVKWLIYLMSHVFLQTQSMVGAAFYPVFVGIHALHLHVFYILLVMLNVDMRHLFTTYHLELLVNVSIVGIYFIRFSSCVNSLRKYVDCCNVVSKINGSFKQLF